MTPFVFSVVARMFAPSVGTMMNGEHALATTGGTAWRRRQRRLRAFRRFVLWHSKMEVAAALHHTSRQRTSTTAQFSSTAVEPIASRVVGSLPPVEEFTGLVYDHVHQEQFAAGEMSENMVEIPVVQEQVIVQAIPAVVGSLPPVDEFTRPVYNNVYQEQFAAGEMTENLVEIPVVQEQVIVQAIPVVVDSLPPVEEFTGPVHDQVHQELVASSEMTENFAEIPVVQEQVIVQDIPEVIVPLPPAQESSAPVYGQVQQVIVGMRPERLVDARGPQRCVRTVPSVTGLPPLPDLCRGDVHDATLVKFLLRQTLLQRKKEEEERKKEEEEEEKEQFLEQSMQELRLLSKTPLAGRSLQQTNRMMELLKLRDAASSSSSKRKRKKRRKKKLPRGRARRRQRQRPLSGALIVDSGRGMCRAGFSSSRCVPFGCRQAQMLGIMAGMTRRAGFSLRPLVSGSHLFAVLFGSTVDTCYVSLQRLLWVELFVFSAMLGSTVALRDDFL